MTMSAVHNCLTLDSQLLKFFGLGQQGPVKGLKAPGHCGTPTHGRHGVCFQEGLGSAHAGANNLIWQKAERENFMTCSLLTHCPAAAAVHSSALFPLHHHGNAM